MGVKLFTFLGTNDYKETEYFFGDGVRVQKAIKAGLPNWWRQL